jgi:hypothetical protein
MENGFVSQLTCACYRRGVEIRDGEYQLMFFSNFSCHTQMSTPTQTMFIDPPTQVELK